MANSSAAVEITTSWQDVAGALTNVAGVKWQNVGRYPVIIAFTASGSAPANGEGQRLEPGEWIVDADGTAYVWAIAEGAVSSLAATVDPSATGGLSAADSTNLADVETNTGQAVTNLAAIKNAVEATVTTLPPTALGTTSRYSRKIIDISSASEAAQITAVASQIIRVYGFHLITPVAANELAVWNGPITDANQLDLLSFAGAGAGHWWFDPGDPIWITGTNKGLVFKPTGTARLTGLLLYTQGA